MIVRKQNGIILVLLFFLIVIVPQIALASWWNPFSWFSFFHKISVQPIETLNIVATSTLNISAITTRANQERPQVVSTSTTAQQKKIATDNTKKAEKIRQEKINADIIVQSAIEAQRKLDEKNLLQQQVTQKEIEDRKIAEEKARTVMPIQPIQVPLQNNQSLLPVTEQTPQYLVSKKSITILAPAQDALFYIGNNKYKETHADGSYVRIGWAPGGDQIPYSWKWTGSSQHIMPVTYLYNVDTGRDLPEWYLIGNYNNYGVSEGNISSFGLCLPNGFSCPPEFTTGRYQLKICEFPQDKNPNKNALYPVGETPLCASSAVFNINTRPESQWTDIEGNGL